MRMEVLRFSNNLYFLREVQTFFTVSGFFCPVDILKYLAYTKSADRDMLYTCITELTFKRHVMSSAAGTAIWRLSFLIIFRSTDPIKPLNQCVTRWAWPRSNPGFYISILLPLYEVRRPKRTALFLPLKLAAEFSAMRFLQCFDKLFHALIYLLVRQPLRHQRSQMQLHHRFQRF